MEEVSLKDRFPRLFRLCANQDAKVSEMERWIEEEWR